MRKKIRILGYAIVSMSAIGALYVTMQLTKLRDSDILNVYEDEEEWF